MLRRLAARAAARGLPPPAALIGDWFGASAVLAPSVRMQPVTVQGGLPVPAVAQVASNVPGAVGGGWFGYLGYGLTDPGRWQRRLPAAVWGHADHVLRADAAGGWWAEALVPDGVPAPGKVFDELADLVEHGHEPPPRPWRASAPTLPAMPEHARAVRGCLEQIAAGEIYQANVCVRIQLGFHGDPLEVFAAGTERLHPARAAYLAGDWGAVASLSPELFLARHGRTVTSSPIKGTHPRTGSRHDLGAARLRRSQKDIAENVMIVDLMRNDLGQVCEVGGVAVPELLAVQPHPGVWHLVSTVTGRLRPQLTDADLLAATFPPGSVTGAPKRRALQVLAGLETEPREVYCGAVGLLSPAAGTELNVAIRTLEFHAGQAWLGVGGGITADSDPAAEWRECRTKAAPLLRLLG